jgi:UTP--glucose-1-phosphate uridylyltransferase
LIQAHEREGCSVLALEQVDWSEVDKYGVIKPANDETMPIQIESIVEKPARDVAPSNWSVVGRYVLSGKIMDLLKDVQRGTGGEIQLTDGIAQLLQSEKMVGVPLSGKRFDCGNKVGFLEANLHFGLRFLNR